MAPLTVKGFMGGGPHGSLDVEALDLTSNHLTCSPGRVLQNSITSLDVESLLLLSSSVLGLTLMVSLAGTSSLSSTACS